MAERFDIVVIGAGMVGSAIAHFLASDPGFDGTILVVERDPSLKNAATSHTNSCIRQQFSTPLNIAMSQFGLRHLRNFAEEIGEPEAPEIRLEETGYLFLSPPGREDALRRANAVQRECGVGARLMEPAEIAAAFPFLSIDGVALGSHNPEGEGYFDGASMHPWWRKAARRRGATFRAGEVVAMERHGDRVVAVRLADGSRIACGIVVNASGPRCAATARLAGLHAPVEPRKRYSFVFSCREAPAGLFPLIIDPSGVHVRREGAGFLAGCAPADDAAVDFDDFEVDDGIFEERVWPRLAARAPAFEAVRVTAQWAGHYDYNTLDQNLLIGPHPECGNFLFASGFSGHGLQHAAAVGRAVAELAIHGRYRTLDLSELAYARVLEGRAVREEAVI